MGLVWGKFSFDFSYLCSGELLPCLRYENDDASRDDVTTAITALDDLDRRCTRIYGASHPQTEATRICLEEAREKLARAK